jgi:hypothetical protein
MAVGPLVKRPWKKAPRSTAEAMKERTWKMLVAGFRTTARRVRRLTWEGGRKGGRVEGKEDGRH